MSLRLKRTLPLILLLVLLLAVLAFAFGDQRVIAYTTSPVSQAADAGSAVGMDYQNRIDLFDPSVVHSIQVVMDPDDYDQMISTYQQTGEKDYFKADLIIDGVRINEVGIRLKGNASLRSAVGGGGERQLFAQGGQGNGQIPGLDRQFQRPEGGGFIPGGQAPNLDPNNMPQGFDPNNLPQGFEPGDLPGAPGDRNLQPGFQGQGGGWLNLEMDPEKVKIPFQVKFDEYVDGQSYQGYTKIALRTYGTTYNEAMLDELITYEMFEAAGLPAPQVAYTGVQVNDESGKLYLVSQVLDETYLEQHFDNPDGVLFKAELGSSLSYVNDDPSSYVKSFSQETRVNEADYASLIEFSQFISQTDDATFAAELAQRFDVEAFASYLALNNLLVNLDSIAAMNNNYYLYYDDLSGKMTLLMWDGNESLGGLGGRQVTDYDLYYEGQTGMRMPGGSTQNVLFKRFMADPGFRALYEEKLKEMYEVVFTSGAARQTLEDYTHLIRSTQADSGLVDLDTYDQAAAEVENFLSERQAYLESTELLAGR